ncbi:MAG: redox-regulated ATPase YchF [Myxococcales bacterium]|nr:redox-regulated ATPase YchF [Myxococcales bacterium]HIK85845.1 redox-regulated ATPase YchF [Myxococcales bacterium]
MGLTCGIVGLPNVGKSTIFNALTAAGIAAENYPFCTIEPNTGVVVVPDLRLAQLDSLIQSKSVVPTSVEFVDIAGLVKGASQGEGLGNQFLGNIRETNAIIHVVRCFDDENVVHVDGHPDPVRDAETIDVELGLADLEAVSKRADRAQKVAKSGDKVARAEFEFFTALGEHLSSGRPARTFDIPEPLVLAVKEAHLLTAKPVLYVANVDEEGLEKGNAYSQALEKLAGDAEVVRICGKVEAELSELDDDDKREFLADLGIEEPGLNRLIRAAYALLDLVTFFTAGPKEIRAWTVRRGTSAPQAAGEIHSDFEKHFIRAEVIAFDTYIELQGEAEAKAKGAMQVEGKDYIVADGDVIYFRTSA